MTSVQLSVQKVLGRFEVTTAEGKVIGLGTAKQAALGVKIWLQAKLSEAEE